MRHNANAPRISFGGLCLPPGGPSQVWSLGEFHIKSWRISQQWLHHTSLRARQFCAVKLELFTLGRSQYSILDLRVLSDCVPSLKGMPRFVEERRQKVNLLLGLYVLLCYCSSNSISSGSSITTTSPASVEADHLPIENFPPDIGPVQVLRRLCKRERYPGK